MKAFSTRTRPLQLAVATLVLAVAGGLSLSAAHAAPPMGGPGGPGAMGGEMGGGMGGPMMMMGGHLDRLLDRVNATAEQRTQVQAIMKAARDDLRTQREAGRSLHTQMAQLFAAATVDARAIETLRQQLLAQHDQASKRMTQALIDASRVLSADQRKQIGDLMAQQRSMMERHRSERESLMGKPPAR